MPVHKVDNKQHYNKNHRNDTYNNGLSIMPYAPVGKNVIRKKRGPYQQYGGEIFYKNSS